MLDPKTYLSELESEKQTVQSENVEQMIEDEMAKIREQVAQQVKANHDFKIILLDSKIDAVKHILEIKEN